MPNHDLTAHQDEAEERRSTTSVSLVAELIRDVGYGGGCPYHELGDALFGFDGHVIRRGPGENAECQCVAELEPALEREAIHRIRWWRR